MTDAPDFSYRIKLKSKYLKLQRNYQHSLKVRSDLQLELAEKTGKLAKLQDEIDLLIDQIHDSDYAHLKPQPRNFTPSPSSNPSLPSRHSAPTAPSPSRHSAPTAPSPSRHSAPTAPSPPPINSESSHRPLETPPRMNDDPTPVAEASTTQSRIRKERSPEQEINSKRPRIEQLN